MFFKEGFIKITGKGDKQRFVPIGDTTIKYIELYRKEVRVHQNIAPRSEERRVGKASRSRLSENH